MPRPLAFSERKSSSMMTIGNRKRVNMPGSCNLLPLCCNLRLRSSRDLQVHERAVLLAAEDIVIVDVARDGRARDGDLDRRCGVVVDDRDDLRPEAVGAREPLSVDHACVAHPLVGSAVLQDHVEGQLERTGVLAADELGDLPELHRTVSYSILNISRGEAGSTTWFRLKR